MLGVKLEDRQALDWAADTLSVPGLAFAEHGSATWDCPMATWKVGPTRRCLRRWWLRATWCWS